MSLLEISKKEALERLIDLPEQQLVRFVCDHSPSLYDFFNYVIEPALGSPMERKGWNYILLTEVPLTDFGFRSGLQPGDVDVLIVPTWDGEPFPEHMAAIEIKRLALRGPNWTKNTDRYGVKQAHGLLRCGFPIVGLMHLIVSAPGPASFHAEMQQAEIIDADGRARLLGPKVVDLTGFHATERQLKRLATRQIHPAIGLNAVAMGNGAGPTQIWMSPNVGRFATKRIANPALVRNVKILLENYGRVIRPRFADREGSA